MAFGDDAIIGIDAGTTIFKSVAFEISSRQISAASFPNRCNAHPDGAATQSIKGTWKRCIRTLRGLVKKVDNPAPRTAAIAVTGQGDGA